MAGAQPLEGPPLFATQLIAALEEAQAAASVPKTAAQLAETAWRKLQFDFPMVEQEELEALIDEYATGRRSSISSDLLDALREGATAPLPGGDAAAPTLSSSQGQVPLYQRLYAVAVVQALLAALEAPEADAAQQLADLQPASSWLAPATADSLLEQALAAASIDGTAAAGIELQHRASQQEDDDSTAYEPLEQAVPQWQPAASPSPFAAHGAAGGAPLPALLELLGSHLSYHSMADSGTWRELRLMRRLAACLGAARRHPRFLELAEVVQPVLRLAADRLVAAPHELEAGLPAVLDALGVPGGASGGGGSTGSAGSKQDVAAAAAAREHALAVAVALATQLTPPSARRWLWQEVHQRLLASAGGQLEQQQVALARQARAAGSAGVSPTPEQLYSIVLPCQLLYFYILQGAGGAGRLQESLLQSGVLRSLVLLFVQVGGHPVVEPLRCALLLACAAAQPLAEWAAAVPGFLTAAAAAPAFQPGGDAQLHGALWRVLLGGDGGSLSALLLDAQPAAKVPGVYVALQLMADMQAARRRPQPLWDASVEAALRELAATLRQHYSMAREEAAKAAAGKGASIGSGGEGAEAGSVEGSEEDEDAAKLAMAPEEQAALVVARRARQLQPACLKLVKELLQHGGAGAGSKHD